MLSTYSSGFVSLNSVGEYDIDNSDGHLLRYLELGASGSKLIKGTFIPGSASALNILDTY